MISLRERLRPPEDAILTAWFLTHGIARSVAPGGLCVRTFPEGFVLVRTGLLLLEHSIDTAAAAPCFATLVFGGELFATSSFRHMPPLQIRALLETSMVMVSSDEVARNATPAVHTVLATKLADVVARSSRQAFAISAVCAELRFLMLMVALGSRLGTAFDDAVKFELPMSRQQMAEYLGLNPETLSRAITKAKQRGLISFAGRHDVTLPDWRRLIETTPLGERILAANSPTAA